MFCCFIFYSDVDPDSFVSEDLDLDPYKMKGKAEFDQQKSIFVFRCK